MGSLVSAEGAGSFRFGAASAATQIEDQNPSTDWYVFTRPAPEGLGKGHAFVGEAAGGYTRAISDIQLIKAMGLDSYRFSIEWARIEPERDRIDETALQHYSDFIDALLAEGIRPMLTLHHFSNPTWVADPRDSECVRGPSDVNLCGLGHPVGGPLVVEEMRQHAALIASRFGNRVDEWATLNEPVNYLLAAYGVGSFPPGRSLVMSSLLEGFMPVVRDYLHAHAAMYAAVKAADLVDADGDGSAADVGFTLATPYLEASRDNAPSDEPTDIEARDRADYVMHQLFVQAVLDGAFDPELDGTASEPQPEWAGTLDWLGVQYYMRVGVTGTPGLLPVLNLTPCFGGFDFGSCLPPLDPNNCVPSMKYEYLPEGLYHVLSSFSRRWPELPLVVTESGLATRVGERRAENVVRALEQIQRARGEGADVRGYYYWSLYDNFEWAEGFDPRFGLYTVDYANFERTPTLGAKVLGEIAKARSLGGENVDRYGGTGPLTPESGTVSGQLCSTP